MPKNNVANKLKKIQKVPNKEKNIPEILRTLKEENKSEEQKITISFKFWDRENKLFNLGEIESEWFIELLDMLKLLSNITKKQLFGEYRDKFEPHPYNDIDKLNYPDEMLTNPQYEAWQLRITKSKGRVHGFFVENTYYVRFIDRWHNMYNDVKYGGIVFKVPPISMYSMLETKYKETELKLQKAEKQINEGFNAVCENCSECSKVDKVYKFFEN